MSGFYADEVYDRIETAIQLANEDKPDDCEMTVYVLIGTTEILVDSFGYQNPSFVLVHGVDCNDKTTVEALVPHTNVNVVIKYPKTTPDTPKQQIGFIGDLGADKS